MELPGGSDCQEEFVKCFFLYQEVVLVDNVVVFVFENHVVVILVNPSKYLGCNLRGVFFMFFNVDMDLSGVSVDTFNGRCLGAL